MRRYAKVLQPEGFRPAWPSSPSTTGWPPAHFAWRIRDGSEDANNIGDLLISLDDHDDCIVEKIVPLET